MKDRLIYIGFSFLHHGEHAGYDQIRKYVPYDKIIDCQKAFNLKMRVDTWPKGFRRLFKFCFGDPMRWIEWRLILMSLLSRRPLHFHIIYGENIFLSLGKYKRHHKITLTLHQPPSFFEDEKNSRFKMALANVDRLIVMSKEMEVYFQKEFPQIETLFIPHGLDVDYFVDNKEKSNQVLMVGNWLRDFEFADIVFSRLKELKPEVNIKVLTSSSNHHFFDNKVTCLSGISDDELLLLYQKSKVVFLPLSEYTANNAVLEACSCGCQVVIASPSNVIDDEERPMLFLGNDKELVVSSIIRIIDDWDVAVSNYSRAYVVDNYSWAYIAELSLSFLR